jgi:hypothetical protein
VLGPTGENLLLAPIGHIAKVWLWMKSRKACSSFHSLVINCEHRRSRPSERGAGMAQCGLQGPNDSGKLVLKVALLAGSVW